MRNRIISIGIMLVLLINSAAFAAETEDAAADNAYYAIAEELLTAVNNNYIPFEGETVTRGEFVSRLVLLTGGASLSGGESGFSDAGAYEAALSAAQTLGIIGRYEKFRPTENITYLDAIVMCVNAAGYTVRAAAKGGVPSGYLAAAGQIKLFKNISAGYYEPLSAKAAQVLLYNTLNAEILTQETFGEGSTFTSSEDRTILSEVYNVYRKEGVLSANGYTTLSDPTENAGEASVEIDGEIFCDGCHAGELIGYNVLSFYRKDDLKSTVIAAWETDNKTAAVDCGELTGFENERISVSDKNGKSKAYRLSPAYDLIYNGKAYTGKINLEFLEECDELMLADNDKDGRYDVVLASKYKYILAAKVNDVAEAIYDSDAGDGIELGNKDISYTVFDVKNKKYIELYEIKKDTLVGALISEDNKLVRLYAYRDTAEGTVSAVDAEGRSITVDGEQYDVYAGFFDDFSGVSAGTAAVFYIGHAGKIILAADIQSEMRYGYAVKCGEFAGDDIWGIKLLDQGGQMMYINLADTIIVDKVKLDYEAVVTLVNSSPQLVRYRLNSDAELRVIDTSELYSGSSGRIGFADFSKLAETDRLIETKFGVSSFLYKSAIAFLQPCVSLSGTKVFCIPTAEEQKRDNDNYYAGGSNIFPNDYELTANNIRFYNVNEYGVPEAVVYYGDYHSLSTLDASSRTAVIQKRLTTINADDEICAQLQLYYGDTFYTYYLDTDIDETALKSSKQPLGAGDLVRFSAEEDTITDIIVDFDANPNVMAANSLSTAHFNKNVSVSLAYNTGKLYSQGGGFAYITPQPADNGIENGPEYDYSYANLRLVAVKNPVLVTMMYNGSKFIGADIRSVDWSEICTYRDSSGGADYLVARDRYGEAYQTIVYRIEQ